MAVIRLTKEFAFESAHALENYDGACREIHGHSYRLFVTVKGSPIGDRCSPKCGMIMDFGDLKRIVNDQIISSMDHSFVLRRSQDNDALEQLLCGRFQRVIMVDYQPTCENMLSDFAARIAAQLPLHISLYSLKLHETATSFAEWYAADNQ